MELKSKTNHLDKLKKQTKKLITKKNKPVSKTNGIYKRYKNPVLTNDHAPIHWRYDLNTETNPYQLERIGINAAFNAGALKWNDHYILCARVEGNDRKSFFAIAESPNGVDNFKFWDKPCVIPQIEGNPDTNVYDMRLIKHEDGWVYGIFCTERKDPNAPDGDTSSAIANAGIVRTKDLLKWERLPDLVSNSGQQRNVVLHPEFVNGKYGIYTRPQDGFIDIGNGGGIGFGYIDTMENPVVKDEKIINNKITKPNKSLGLVIKLMDEFIEKKQVDKQRIYVSGLSMGGMGTFEILFRRPDMFAAATPICGNGIPQLAKLYAEKVPLWIFHGSDDNVVSPKYSLAMAKAIIEAGGSPKMTLYENTGHGSWNNAFAEKNFLKWIHSKSNKQ